MDPIDLHKIFGHSQEFKYISVREEEKHEVSKFMKKVTYPEKVQLKSQVQDERAALVLYIPVKGPRLHANGGYGVCKPERG